MESFDPAILGIPKAQAPAGKTAADQKFDNLFGGGDDDAIIMISEPAKTTDNSIANLAAEKTGQSVRKMSGQEAVRKMSRAASNAKSSYTLEQALAGGPRRRYTKKELLDMFKQTSTLDENVFDSQSVKENSQLLIIKAETDPEAIKEKILSGSLEDEDEDENEDGMGLLPENLNSTTE